MHPELPYLAAGAIALTGATIKDGHFPPLSRAAVGTIGAVVIASAFTDTRFAPLVHGIGMLVLLAAVMAATNATIHKARLKKNLPPTVPHPPAPGPGGGGGGSW